MSKNTYGSLGLRFASLNDCFGKSVKTETLFINLYDYWTNFHDEKKKMFLAFTFDMETWNVHP